MQFDKGYVSPYMVTDTEKMEAILENPYILITDKKLVIYKSIATIRSFDATIWKISNNL